MGCITAGNPIIDLETFDYKNKRWNHKFLKCGTDNLCLFCRSKGKAYQRSLTESSEQYTRILSDGLILYHIFRKRLQ